MVLLSGSLVCSYLKSRSRHAEPRAEIISGNSQACKSKPQSRFLEKVSLKISMILLSILNVSLKYVDFSLQNVSSIFENYCPSTFFKFDVRGSPCLNNFSIVKFHKKSIFPDVRFCLRLINSQPQFHLPLLWYL